jgi:hypothetical protein
MYYCSLWQKEQKEKEQWLRLPDDSVLFRNPKSPVCVRHTVVLRRTDCNWLTTSAHSQFPFLDDETSPANKIKHKKMNLESSLPTIGLNQQDKHGLSTSGQYSPTPMGSNVEVVDRLSSNSLFCGLDQITTNFLQETFLGINSEVSLSSNHTELPGALFDLRKSDMRIMVVDRMPDAAKSEKGTTISYNSSFPSPSNSVCASTGTSSSKGSHWSEKFNELVQFHKQFGHCLVPNNWEKNVRLAQWVKRQRHQYKVREEGKNSPLSDDKIRTLEAIGFSWSVQEDTWEERFSELKAYRRIHGHTNVPKHCSEHPRLSVWVKYQRRHWRLYLEGQHSSMTEDRLLRLTELDFKWNPRKTKIDGRLL